jgi:Na+-translocating ferredoxin:NAD+ oxidoreductase RnfG subunit
VFAVVWLAIFTVMLGMVRQEVKEAIEYGAKVGVTQAIRTVLQDPEFDKELWPKIKQNTKEAIEYAAITTARQQATQSSTPAKK